MHPVVEELLEREMPQLRALCARYGVHRLLLFGSGLSLQWDSSTSDLDLAAEFGPLPEGVDLFAQFFVFKTELEALFGRPVDLVEISAIRRPTLLLELDTRGIEVYAA